MKQPDIHRFEELFKRHPAPAPRLRPINDSLPTPGQIWSLANSGPRDLFNEVVVLGHPNKEDGLETVDVAPLVHDATTAGPKDYILPENVLCHHAAVLLGMEFSLPTGKLGACKWSLDAPLIQQILIHYAKVQDGSQALADRHAPHFIDARDFRYGFQEQAAAQISGLQAEIYQWMDAMEAINKQAPVISTAATKLEAGFIDASHIFAQLSPAVGLAAAGSELPFQLDSFDLPIDYNGIRGKLVICQSVIDGNVSLAILGPLADICAKVLGSSGKVIASFDNGEARFGLTAEIGNFIVIADKLGQAIVTLKRR